MAALEQGGTRAEGMRVGEQQGSGMKVGLLSQVPDGVSDSKAAALTTLAFFSAFVCFTQRSCVSGRTVEMALDSDNLLLLQVAPCSFRPVGRRATWA